MDEDHLIGLLPAPYAVAVRLRRAGVPDSSIAVAAGVDEAAVAPLVHLAEAKLHTLALASTDSAPLLAETSDGDRPPAAPNPLENLP